MSATSIVTGMYYPPGSGYTSFYNALYPATPAQLPEYYAKGSTYDRLGELPYILNSDFGDFSKAFSWYGGDPNAWVEVPHDSQYYPKEVAAQYANWQVDPNDPFNDPRTPVYMREADLSSLFFDSFTNGYNGNDAQGSTSSTPGTTSAAPAPTSLASLPTDPTKYTPVTPQTPIAPGSLGEFAPGVRPEDTAVRAGLSTAYNYSGDIPSGWGVGAGTNRGTGLANASQLTKPQW